MQCQALHVFSGENKRSTSADSKYEHVETKTSIITLSTGTDRCLQIV